MAKADVWMPLYIADYLRDTMHLTTAEHGAYLLLIMAAWSGGGRLSNRPRSLAGIAKMTLAEWEEVAPVILPFFNVDGAELVHGRVRLEREKAQKLSDVRREVGAKGGRPRKQTETCSEPIAKPIVDADDTQTTSQPETPAQSPSPPPQLDHTLDASSLGSAFSHEDLQRRLRDAAGEALADPAKAPAVLALTPILALLTPGNGSPPCDLELDVLPVIKARSTAKPAGSVRSWALFTNAIAEARDQRLAGAPAMQPVNSVLGNPDRERIHSSSEAKFAAKQANMARAARGAALAIAWRREGRDF